ncbi:hypothetical protein ACTWP4_01165 [Gracilibacillus sp. D59]|uniref:hypothetical protein n=1 Tax=Gracilibacillus sp. D59 TaxID=3457434 RepID=UPI003FCC76B5
MSHNEDELIKELKDLKTNAQLDPHKKESMKMALQKHAKKKRTKSTAKQTFIWFSTAAAILVCGVLVYTMINTDQITLPADDNQSNEEIGNAGEDTKNPNDMEGLSVDETEDKDDMTIPGQDKTPDKGENDNEDVSPQDFKVNRIGEETQTISIEGTEENTKVYKYRMEPYGIEYKVDEYFSKYAIEGTTVRYHDESDKYASIRLYVEENAMIEELATEFQAQYSEKFDNVSEIEEPKDGNNPYSGLTFRAKNQHQGYYLYQIEDNVLVIQYEYAIEAGDGMARLQSLIESIR